MIKDNRLSEKERRNLSILDSIRRGGEVSRAEISKMTDLNIVTVSNYVSKYIKKKLVFETGLDISTGGRRPELLKINRDYGYSVGIDLGSPHLTIDAAIVGVVMDISGRIIARESVPKEVESFEKFTEKVMSMTSALVERSAIPPSSLKGIGVGIWGVLDRYRGMVRYPVEEEQIVSYMTLLNDLEDKFGVPTLIDHDATLAAFGERWGGIGEGSTADNLIFLCSDSSCGIIIRGELYCGATRSAGELNLNPPPEGSEPDPAHPWASYEYGSPLRSRGLDLGIPGRIREYIKNNPAECGTLLETAGGDPESIDFKAVIAAAEKGDKVAHDMLVDAGDYLGTKIAFLINLFNPEVVVVGRGVEKAGDIFFTAVRKAVRKWGYEESVKVVKILPTSLGDNVVATGAAALVIQNLFAGV